MTRGEDCRDDDDLTLLSCGLGIVRLIDGDEVERLMPGDEVERLVPGDEVERLVPRDEVERLGPGDPPMRGRSPGIFKEGTRGRGVDGTNGGAVWDGEPIAPKTLLERAVRTEPATDGEVLGFVESC